MKRPLLLLALGLGALMTACGAVGDPLANAIGIHDLTLVPSTACDTVKLSVTHAGQQSTLESGTPSARIRVASGAPVLISGTCTYVTTTTENNVTTTKTHVDPLSATYLTGSSTDLYFTTGVNTAGRQVYVTESTGSTPALVQVNADASACTGGFQATLHSGAGTVHDRTLTADHLQELMYVSTGVPLHVSAACARSDSPTGVLEQDVIIPRNGTVLIGASVTDTNETRLSATFQ